MIAALTIGVLATLGAISYQDIRERSVFWWLLPVLTLLLGGIHLKQTPAAQVFIWTSLTNLLLVLLLFLGAYAYTRFVAQQAFLNVSMGLGDILFLLGLAFAFPTLTFVVLLVFGLGFALVVFLFGKRQWGWKTVPLAGLLSLFLAGCLLFNLCSPDPLLYRF